MDKWADCKKCKDNKKYRDEGDISYRGCRLAHAFPNAYTKRNGLLFFDTNKISKSMQKSKSQESEKK